jgi:hypothetical protein
MARKPESVFYSAVHKLLPAAVHREKMNNPYSSGTADCWYSGLAADLWIEYKFLPALPAHDTTLVHLDLSKLQRDWLNGRYQEGRHVAVVVGLPRLGGVMLVAQEWEVPWSKAQFIQRIIPRSVLAEIIRRHTMEDAHVTQTARAIHAGQLCV